MDLFASAKGRIVAPAQALPGRAEPLLRGELEHAVLGSPLLSDARELPEGVERAIFAMGCFWGAERIFWRARGVYSTAVGYCGGFTPNPTYEEVCSGRTGHAEAVLVAHRPREIAYEQLLTLFWEGHDPTQGMRQGNDIGTQYRSAIYWTTEAQLEAALASREAYQARLSAAGYGEITTEIEQAGEGGAGPFYLAELYHQQYLHKNPAGYCGLGGTGVACPAGLAR